MQVSEPPDHPTRGLWWKSFLVSQFAGRLLALPLIASGVEVPATVGGPVGLAAWALTWLVWRQRLINRSRRNITTTDSFVRLHQRLTGLVGLLLGFLAQFVLILSLDGPDRTGVAVAPVSLAVAAVSLLATFGWFRLVPKAPIGGAREPAFVLGWYRDRFMARLPTCVRRALGTP